jgi:hypothetical protein
MLSYDQIKDNPKVLLAFTGHAQAEFDNLLKAFIRASHNIERKLLAKRKRRRQPVGGRKAYLKNMADRLVFILFYLKTYPIQEVQAFLFGMSQGQANEWIHRLAKVLQQALDDLGHLPERDGTGLASILQAYETLAFAGW